VALRPTLSDGLPLRALFIRRPALLNISVEISEADLTGVTQIDCCKKKNLYPQITRINADYLFLKRSVYVCVCLPGEARQSEDGSVSNCHCGKLLNRRY
jgi:hypothetical protein